MDGGENVVDTLVQNFRFLRDGTFCLASHHLVAWRTCTNHSSPPHTAFFSEQTLHFLNTHLLSPSSPLQTLRRQLFDLAHTLLALMAPVLNPLLNRLGEALYNSPDVVVLCVSVLLLVLVLQVLAWVRRVVLWATALLMRVVFWTCVVAALAFAYQRGMKQTASDAAVVGAKVVGYGRAVRDVWLTEYRRYEAQQQHAVRR